MDLWLLRLLTRSPEPIKRQALVQLFRSTATAFGCDMPRLRGLSREQCLLAYAHFTAERCAEALERGASENGGRAPADHESDHGCTDTHGAASAIRAFVAYPWSAVPPICDAPLERGGDLADLRQRLYRGAFRLGRVPGRLVRARSVEDVMGLARFFYSILDIEFQGSPDGEITIGRCYFSRYYSAQVCRVMSAMDSGLLAGLAGSGGLVFSQRITEGQPCCAAHFSPAGGPPASRSIQEQNP